MTRGLMAGTNHRLAPTVSHTTVGLSLSRVRRSLDKVTESLCQLQTSVFIECVLFRWSFIKWPPEYCSRCRPFLGWYSGNRDDKWPIKALVIACYKETGKFVSRIVLIAISLNVAIFGETCWRYHKSLRTGRLKATEIVLVRAEVAGVGMPCGRLSRRLISFKRTKFFVCILYRIYVLYLNPLICYYLRLNDERSV